MGKKMDLRDRTAVVTGAGSGIGRGIALALARRGCHLVLADINAEGLAETAQLASRDGLRVSQHRLDIGQREAVCAFATEVAKVNSHVDLLFNNAGVALGGTFEQISEAEFDWLMDINFQGVVRMTRAFLPALHKSSDARLVNVSSLWGIMAVPQQSAYCASKFAVRGFSEALRHELEGTKVGVTVVHPGSIKTNIVMNARTAAAIPTEEAAKRRAEFQKLLRLPAGEAGEIIVRSVEARKVRVLVGTDAKVMSLIERVIPTSYWNLLKGRHARRYRRAD